MVFERAAQLRDDPAVVRQVLPVVCRQTFWKNSLGCFGIIGLCGGFSPSERVDIPFVWLDAVFCLPVSSDAGHRERAPMLSSYSTCLVTMA